MQPAHLTMFSVSPTVWIVIILLVIAIFGAGKLPDLARNLGKSAKILKEEIRDLQDEPNQQQERPKQEKPENKLSQEENQNPGEN